MRARLRQQDLDLRRIARERPASYQNQSIGRWTPRSNPCPRRLPCTPRTHRPMRGRAGTHPRAWSLVGRPRKRNHSWRPPGTAQGRSCDARFGRRHRHFGRHAALVIVVLWCPDRRIARLYPPGIPSASAHPACQSDPIGTALHLSCCSQDLCPPIWGATYQARSYTQIAGKPHLGHTGHSRSSGRIGRLCRQSARVSTVGPRARGRQLRSRTSTIGIARPRVGHKSWQSQIGMPPLALDDTRRDRVRDILPQALAGLAAVCLACVELASPERQTKR